MHKYRIYYNSILNEINIDENILNRLNRKDINYIPTRTVKLLPFLDKYKIGKCVYFFINFIYFLIGPLFYVYKLFDELNSIKKIKNNSINLTSRIILFSSSKIYPLSKKVYKDKILFIDINQKTILSDENYTHIKQFLVFYDYINAFLYATIGFIYVSYYLKDKTNLLQNYVAYDWFLVYIALEKLNKIKEVDEVIFANHYDRWATMFDQLFKSKKIILIQHGLLPDSLELAYKLKNLNTIYRFNKESEDLFKQIFDCSKVEFKKLDSTIVLRAVEHHEKSILIIGQPQSIKREIEIIKALQKTNNYNIYIKPHPLFDTIQYKSLNGINLISDKTFFPRVDVALSYESTLGLEYESSGVRVLWYKDLNTRQTIKEIKQLFNKM